MSPRATLAPAVLLASLLLAAPGSAGAPADEPSQAEDEGDGGDEAEDEGGGEDEGEGGGEDEGEGDEEAEGEGDEEAEAEGEAGEDEGEAADPEAGSDEVDPGPEAAASAVLEVIGTRTRAIDQIPGAATVLDEELVERTRPLEPTELLRTVPGVVASSDEGMGLRMNIGLRGNDPNRSRKVLVLEDGVPVSINPYGEPDLYYSTPVERVEGAEVVRGAGSILFGPRTVGGVVNFRTISPPTERRWVLDVQGGLPGTFRGLGSYGDSLGPVRFFVQLMHKRGEGFRSVGFDATDLFGKLAFATSRRSDATVKVGAYAENSEATYVGLTRGMFEQDPHRPSLAPDDRFKVRRYELSLVHDLRVAPGFTNKTLLYGYITDRIWRRQDYDRAAVSGVRYERIVGDTSIPGAAIWFRDSSTIRDRRYWVVGVEPRFELRGRPRPKLGLGLDFGARLLLEGSRRRIYVTDRVDSWGGSQERDVEQDGLAISGYVQGRVEAGPLRLTPGLRVEWSRFDRTEHRRVEDGEATDVELPIPLDARPVLIPGIGAVVGDAKMQVFGGFHVGSSPARIVSATGTGDEEGAAEDQVLPGELSFNYELGLRARPVPGLFAELTGFVVDFDSEVVPQSLAGGAAYEATGGQQSLKPGLEAAATLQLDALARLPFELALSGQYTFVHATFKSGPNKDRFLPYSPLHRASARLDVEAPFGLGGHVAWSMRGRMFGDAANTWHADATGRVGVIDAAHTLDLSLRWTFERIGLTARVDVKNAVGVPTVGTRRPDGIHPSGYRQILFGLRWETPPGGLPKPRAAARAEAPREPGAR